MLNYRLALAAVFLLTGCKVGIDAKLFTSDLVTVASDGKILETNAVVSIDASTAEKCDEFKDQIGAALTTAFTKAEFVACRRNDVTMLADYRVNIPMMTRKAVEAEAEFPALFIWIDSKDGSMMVNLGRGVEKIKEVIAALPKDLQDTKISSLDPMISVTLQNDLPDPISITMSGAFIDGRGYQLPHETILARRGELNIRLSDVGNANLSDGGSLLFFFAKP